MGGWGGEQESGGVNFCCYCWHGTTPKPVPRLLVTPWITTQVALSSSNFSSSYSAQYPLPAGQKTRNDRWPGNSPSFLGQKLARGGPWLPSNLQWCQSPAQPENTSQPGNKRLNSRKTTERVSEAALSALYPFLVIGGTGGRGELACILKGCPFSPGLLLATKC